MNELVRVSFYFLCCIFKGDLPSIAAKVDLIGLEIL